MKRIKVCCFCERWESGGIESFLCNVLTHMDTQSIQVDIVTAELVESVFTEALRRHGVCFIELSGKQQNLLDNYSLFESLLRKKKYDVIHLNIFHGLSLYYAYIAKQAGISKRIAHSHNSALRKSTMRPVKLLIHWVAKNLFTGSATDLWACSHLAARFLFSRRELKKRGFQFIPNAISLDRFQFDAKVRESVREELGLSNKFVIGNIGRLCYQKNQEFLLEVFAAAMRQRPESHLLLVGEGEAEAALRQKATYLGISNAVVFLGTSAHVEQLLWAMDVFVFPSRFEGLGIAAVEAQAAGLPVLCSDQVPYEAEVTSQVTVLPLNAPKARWVEYLLRPGRIGNRVAAAAEISRKFDIHAVSAKIQRQFISPSGHAE